MMTIRILSLSKIHILKCSDDFLPFFLFILELGTREQLRGTPFLEQVQELQEVKNFTPDYADKQFQFCTNPSSK